MRIVTRPDFDGIVCAVFLLEAETITKGILWVEPGDMQHRRVIIRSGDILANLPYHENCSMWFDHHYTNRIPGSFKGAFEIAPSAAGVVHSFYRDKIEKDFTELVRQADKIDSADLSMDEVVYPEKYPYVLLSMTISGRKKSDEPYWNRLTELLRESDIEKVMQDSEVRRRCQDVMEANGKFRDELLHNTTLTGKVSVTDFRNYKKAPEGNRFLVYSLFRDAVVSVKIRYDNDDREKVIMSVGHSIFNRGCKVNSGLMLSRYNGGGHFGAAACSFHVSKADEYIPEIIELLVKNQPLENQSS